MLRTQGDHFQSERTPKEYHTYNRVPRVHIATDDTQMYPVYESPGSQRGTVKEWADAMQIDWPRGGNSSFKIDGVFKLPFS
jgi:hypothetical protein